MYLGKALHAYSCYKNRRCVMVTNENLYNIIYIEIISETERTYMAQRTKPPWYNQKKRIEMTTCETKLTERMCLHQIRKLTLKVSFKRNYMKILNLFIKKRAITLTGHKDSCCSVFFYVYKSGLLRPKQCLVVSVSPFYTNCLYMTFN